MMLDLSEFNETQLKAVNWEKGNLLVLSGPGAGKSRALAYCIVRYALANLYNVLPYLGVTVTSKGTNRVMAQVNKLFLELDHRNKFIDTQILRFYTFHDFAKRRLQWLGSYLNRKNTFTVLTHEQDQLLFLNQAIESEFPRHSELKSENLLPLINRLAENDVAPDKAAEYLDARFYTNPEIPARIYQRYRSMMPQYDVYDNPSMISDAIRLFEVSLQLSPWHVKDLSGTYPFLCVDEFHNFTPAQYKLFRKMVNPEYHNLFVMADDRKVFDTWDGGNFSLLESIQKDFGMEICRLPDNHHCADEIARAGNKLTVCNFQGSKAIDPVGNFEWRGSSSSISFKQFAEFSDEADWIASSVAELDANSRNKCTVLAGNTSLLKQIAKSLEERGVKTYLPYGEGNFDSVHMNWLVSVLKLAESKIDSCCLQQICKSFDTLCGISINYKDAIPFAKAEGMDYLRSWAHTVLQREETNVRTRSMIADSLIPDLLDRQDYRKFQESAFKWLDELELTISESFQIRANFAAEKVRWEKLVEEISNKHEGKSTTLNTLIKKFKNILTPPVLPDGAITCLKISEFIGSDFERIYVAGMTEGQSPSWESIAKGDNSREMKENRQNFIAAITSTGKTLTLTCSSLLNGQQSNPSRFLDEMGILERDNSASYESKYEPEYEERLVAAE